MEQKPMQHMGYFVVFAICLVGLCGGCEPVSAVDTSQPLEPLLFVQADSTVFVNASQDERPRKLKHAARMGDVNSAPATTMTEDDRIAVSRTDSYRTEGDRTGMFEVGRRAYAKYCIGCHGVDGEGNGESAGFFHPMPRDFTLANYKFSSTPAGSLPTDSDLERTIREGLRGTAMPGWKLMPDLTVEALVVYIKHFSPKWQHGRPAVKIPLVTNPYRELAEKAAAIERGEAVYHGYASCWSCHPAYVSTDRINQYLAMMENPPLDVWRTNLDDSVADVDEFGEMNYPPDFRRDFMRAGMTVDDLYRGIAAGITGTAMPTWADSMAYNRGDGSALVKPTDLWAMAYYVQSLIKQRPARIAPDDVVVRKRPMAIILNGNLPVNHEKPIDVTQGINLNGPEFLED